MDTRRILALQEAMEALEEAEPALGRLRYEVRRAYEAGAPWDMLAGLLRQSGEWSLLKARGEETAAALAEALVERSRHVADAIPSGHANGRPEGYLRTALNVPDLTARS